MLFHLSLPTTKKLVLNKPENIVVPIQKHLLLVDLDLGSAVLGEQDGVAGLEGHGDAGAVGGAAAGADGHDDALVELRLGRLREEDAAGRHFLRRAPLDEDPVQERDYALEGARGGLRGGVLVAATVR